MDSHPGQQAVNAAVNPDLRRNGCYRRYRAPVSVKRITFQGETLGLARAIEAKAQLEGARVNDVLLRLVRHGLQTESVEPARIGEEKARAGD